MNTQLEMLKKHFRTKGDISRVEAESLYRIAALPRRISDLEEEGWVFDREHKQDQTGRRYVRYFVVENDWGTPLGRVAA